MLVEFVTVDHVAADTGVAEAGLSPGDAARFARGDTARFETPFVAMVDGVTDSGGGIRMLWENCRTRTSWFLPQTLQLTFIKRNVFTTERGEC